MKLRVRSCTIVHCSRLYIFSPGMGLQLLTADGPIMQMTIASSFMRFLEIFSMSSPVLPIGSTIYDVLFKVFPS